MKVADDEALTDPQPSSGVYADRIGNGRVQTGYQSRYHRAFSKYSPTRNGSVGPRLLNLNFVGLPDIVP